jgi:23S rRNA (guanine2445-N2)-methyltransferase / 23S rRNA (guanine2069-N7)-methyltransferase
MERFTLVLLCDVGCEEYTSKEIRELVKKTPVQKKGYLTIPDCSLEDAALLCYRSQTASRILVLIQEGEVQSVEDILGNTTFLDYDYSLFLKKDGLFRVSCDRNGEHGFQSKDVEQEIGELLHEKRGLVANLKTPDMVLFCAIHDEAYVFGIDLAGRDLGKRDYKVFHTRKSMRSTVCYAAVRAAGYTGKENLLNPLSSDGVVEIEAALFAARTSPQRFRKEFAFRGMPIAQGTDWDTFFKKLDDSAGAEPSIKGFAPMLRMLKMSRANAKLASVEKFLTLTSCEVSWLDTKVEAKSVDIIVTQPPSSGKNTPLKDVEKLQDDLFKQAKLLLKKNGTVLLIAEKKAEFLNAAEHHSFALKEEREVHMGGTRLLFLKFFR